MNIHKNAKKWGNPKKYKKADFIPILSLLHVLHIHEYELNLKNDGKTWVNYIMQGGNQT